MARKAARKKPDSRRKTRKPEPPWWFRPLRWLRFMVLRAAAILILGMLAIIVLYTVVNPPITHTILAEQRRLGAVDRKWVALEEVAPTMVRSVVAAEDANFCLHWGFDVNAVRAAMQEGGARGGSTISQQVVKNVFLWQGRSWLRKLLEALITPAVEAVWSKRRIVEVYLNVAEMGEGVFGVEAAARTGFGVGPEALSDRQAALIAAVLPSPRRRSVRTPSAHVMRRAEAIMDGAATIRADGRAACFED